MFLGLLPHPLIPSEELDQLLQYPVFIKKWMVMWIPLHHLQIHLMLGVHATLPIWMHYWSWGKMKKACKLMWNISLISGSGNCHAHMGNIGINVVLPGPLRVGDLIFCQRADILIMTWTNLCLESIILAHAICMHVLLWHADISYSLSKQENPFWRNQQSLHS